MNTHTLNLTEHHRLYGLFRQTHKQTGVKVQPPALFFKCNDSPTADNKVARPDALQLAGLFKEATSLWSTATLPQIGAEKVGQGFGLFLLLMNCPAQQLLPCIMIFILFTDKILTKTKSVTS